MLATVHIIRRPVKFTYLPPHCSPGPIGPTCTGHQSSNCIDAVASPGSAASAKDFFFGEVPSGAARSALDESRAEIGLDDVPAALFFLENFRRVPRANPEGLDRIGGRRRRDPGETRLLGAFRIDRRVAGVHRRHDRRFFSKKMTDIEPNSVSTMHQPRPWPHRPSSIHPPTPLTPPTER